MIAASLDSRFNWKCAITHAGSSRRYRFSQGQNTTFNANCSTRGEPVAVMRPKVVVDDTVAPGLEKFALFRMLNASARNCRLNRSLIGRLLKPEASIVRLPGPRRMPRLVLPKVPMAACWNAAVLKYSVRKFTRAGRALVIPGTISA